MSERTIENDEEICYDEAVDILENYRQQNHSKIVWALGKIVNHWQQNKIEPEEAQRIVSLTLKAGRGDRKANRHRIRIGTQALATQRACKTTRTVNMPPIRVAMKPKKTATILSLAMTSPLMMIRIWMTNVEQIRSRLGQANTMPFSVHFVTSMS